MENVVRFLMRFILVPLGYFAAAIAATLVVLIGWWQFAEATIGARSDNHDFAVLGLVIAGPILLMVMLANLLLPVSIGILISEAFAIRSWIFHALNGAVSAWVGWQMFAAFDQSGEPLNATQFVFGAGLAGGFAYWAVAGWNAGFWKPVFARRELPPPPGNPFNPPAQTKA